MLVYSIALIAVVIFKPTGLLGTREFCFTNALSRLIGKGKTEIKDGGQDE